MGVITCPGEDAECCDSRVRKGYDGTCENCPLKYVDSFQAYQAWHSEEEVA